MPTIIKIMTTIAAPIQSGDKTHHHDHVILPINFNVIKTIVKSPTKPIPPELDEDVSDILNPPLFKEWHNV